MSEQQTDQLTSIKVAESNPANKAIVDRGTSHNPESQEVSRKRKMLAVVGTLHRDGFLRDATERGAKWAAVTEAVVAAIPGVDIAAAPIGAVAGVGYELVKRREKMIQAWRTGVVA